MARASMPPLLGVDCEADRTVKNELILTAAAFGAGVLNTIAGGGTFLTFPALTYTGVPVVVSNATSSVAVFPGYLAGALGYRSEVLHFDRKRLLQILTAAALGGLVGSLLLLLTTDRAFSFIVPFLLSFSTLAFAFGKKLQATAKHIGGKRHQSLIGITLVGVYGGYFNGGLGIVLLALFAYWGLEDINLMNGLKNAVSFVLSSISVVTFAVAGIVSWPQALLMMIAASAGGYLGAPIARRLAPVVVKSIIVGVGTILSTVFFIRLLN